MFKISPYFSDTNIGYLNELRAEKAQQNARRWKGFVNDVSYEIDYWEPTLFYNSIKKKCGLVAVLNKQNIAVSKAPENFQRFFIFRQQPAYWYSDKHMHYRYVFGQTFRANQR